MTTALHIVTIVTPTSGYTTTSDDDVKKTMTIMRMTMRLAVSGIRDLLSESYRGHCNILLLVLHLLLLNDGPVDRV